MQRIRPVIAWLMLATLPLTWGWGTPQAVLCVRADGTVEIETSGSGPCAVATPAAASPAGCAERQAKAVADDSSCGVCADFPLHVRYLTATPPAMRHTESADTLNLSAACGMPASDVEVSIRDARAPRISTTQVPLLSLRTVLLLI